MPRNRTPRAKALIEGRDIVHPERHRNRNEPALGIIGAPPLWMNEAQRDSWTEFTVEAPWLNYSHRCLVGIASILRARVSSGEEVGVQAMGLLRLCLSSMGMTPTDASKVAWKPHDDEDKDDILD